MAVHILSSICILSSVALTQSHTLSNANNWAYWVFDNAKIGNDPNGNSGGVYPRGTAGAIYEDGLFWGGYVGDPNPNLPQLRLGGHHYRQGVQPGWIQNDGTALNPDDPRARVYRIRQDHLRMSVEQLRVDAKEVFQIENIDLVTDEDVQAIRAQYARDWEEWPGDLGAPFIDENNNGWWDAGIDKPGILNASQVIWFVTNDLDTSLTLDLHGSPPIGIEYQTTIWSWAYQGTENWRAQTVYFRHRLINKSQFTVESMYIGRWSDPDLGSHTNDFVGCDTMMNLAYVYNDPPSDSWYDRFGLPPAAAGHVLLQGPIVPRENSTAQVSFEEKKGFANLGMTSFTYFAAGSGQEWPLGRYEGTLQTYNMLRGYLPTNDIANPSSYIAGSGPDAGEPTKFALSGDPVNDPDGLSSDVDGAGSNLSSSDRTMINSSGPFDFAPGDTQEVIYALVGGIDPAGDERTSIAKLKENVADVISHFGELQPTQNTQVHYDSDDSTQILIETELYLMGEVSAVDIELYPTIGPVEHITLSLNDNGLNGDFLEQDGVWTIRTHLLNRKNLHHGDLIIRYTDGRIDSIEAAIHSARLRPAPVLENLRLAWEGGRQDEQFNNNETAYLAFDIRNTDAVNTLDSVIVTADNSPISNYTPSIFTTIAPAALFSDDSLYIAITAPASRDSVRFSVEIVFDGHHVTQEYAYPISPWTPSPVWNDIIEITPVIGATDDVTATIVDAVELTGHQYAIRYRASPQGMLQWQLLDLTLGRIAHDWRDASNAAHDFHTIVDGIQFIVHDHSHSPEFLSFQAVANAGGLLEEPVSAGVTWQGFPTVLSSDGLLGNPPHSQQIGNGHWAIHTHDNGECGSYATFRERTARGDTLWPEILGSDYEIRFTEEGSWAWDYYNSGRFFRVPFELWQVGIAAENDVSDDFRLLPYLLDDDSSGSFNMPIWGTRLYGSDEHSASIADNDPYTDSFYWMNPAGFTLEPQSGETAYQLAADSMAAGTYSGGNATEIMARMVLMNWNGDISDTLGHGDYTQALPEEGTIFRIIARKPNNPGDSLVLQAPMADSTNFFPKRTTLFQNYPNPFNATTTIKFEINHKMNVKLEVFDILGRRVKTLADRFLPGGYYEYQWDGTTETGLPAATGLYLYRLTGFTIAKSGKMLLIR